MERSIKFKGKDAINGRWIYGGIAEDSKGNIVILPKNDWGKGGCVIPETVGQSTGLLDKNKNEIYEHDLIQDEEGVIYEIWYSEEKACFMAEMVNPQNDMVDILGCYDTERCFEIIGNIHDNPELLKGGEQ